MGFKLNLPKILNAISIISIILCYSYFMADFYRVDFLKGDECFDDINIALDLFHSHKFDYAIKYNRKAIESCDDGGHLANMQMVIFQYWMEDMHSSIEMIEEIDDDDPFLDMLLVMNNFDLGNFELAENILENLSSIDGFEDIYFYYKAKLRFVGADYEEALELFFMAEANLDTPSTNLRDEVIKAHFRDVWGEWIDVFIMYTAKKISKNSIYDEYYSKTGSRYFDYVHYLDRLAGIKG